jgi:hypothetical protein
MLRDSRDQLGRPMIGFVGWESDPAGKGTRAAESGARLRHNWQVPADGGLAGMANTG